MNVTTTSPELNDGTHPALLLAELVTRIFAMIGGGPGLLWWLWPGGRAGWRQMQVMVRDFAALMQRITGRFAESGRPDDNPETFKVRLGAYNAQTAPLLPYYKDRGRLVEVDGMGAIDVVAKAIDQALAASR